MDQRHRRRQRRSRTDLEADAELIAIQPAAARGQAEARVDREAAAPQRVDDTCVAFPEMFAARRPHDVKRSVAVRTNLAHGGFAVKSDSRRCAYGRTQALGQSPRIDRSLDGVVSAGDVSGVVVPVNLRGGQCRKTGPAGRLR